MIRISMTTVAFKEGSKEELAARATLTYDGFFVSQKLGRCIQYYIVNEAAWQAYLQRLGQI